MREYRAVYAMVEDTPFDGWVRGLWQGDLPVDDPLRCLLGPDDLRGEVAAWGGVHVTDLDALEITDVDAFAEIVKCICSVCPPPSLTPWDLAIFGRALVVTCEAPELKRVNAALMKATSHLIARAPLTDEERQRAEWWIGHVGVQVDANLQALHAACQKYLEAGSPPLPTSRHFRLGYLMRLWKELQRAAPADRESCAAGLDYFLTHGEPAHYAVAGSPHITLASGLEVQDEADKQAQLAEFRQSLWQAALARLKPYRPRQLAIMGEHPTERIDVRFFDWLTETFVDENRPAFTVIDTARFA
jgi:hypothetical protein